MQVVAFMAFLCIMEGFFLVYREPQTLGGSWVVFVFFILDKCMETLIVSVSLLHAFIHIKWKTYFFWSLIWVTICIFSTVPAISLMKWNDAFNMVNHIATSIFYSFAGGLLFWIALFGLIAAFSGAALAYFRVYKPYHHKRKVSANNRVSI